MLLTHQSFAQSSLSVLARGASLMRATGPSAIEKDWSQKLARLPHHQVLLSSVGYCASPDGVIDLLGQSGGPGGGASSSFLRQSTSRPGTTPEPPAAGWAHHVQEECSDFAFIARVWGTRLEESWAICNNDHLMLHRDQQTKRLTLSNAKKRVLLSRPAE